MLFGEIIEPGTRAFCNDSDEESENTIQTSFQWEGNNEIPTKVTDLLVLEGKALIDFFHKTTLNDKEIVCKSTKTGVSIFKLKTLNEFYVCLCENKSENDGQVIEAILPWISSSKKVTAIQSRSGIDYQSKLRTERAPCLIKALNHKCDVPSNIATLESPNILTGITAGVTSYRVYLDLPGVLFVCYIDNLPLDTVSANPIVELFTELKIPIKKYIPDPPKIHSNLYM